MADCSWCGDTKTVPGPSVPCPRCAERDDATDEPAGAVVTREHRMLAIACIEEWEYGMLTPDHKAWLDGLPTEGEYGLEQSTAQAIADAEARGRASRDAELERVRRELAEALAGIAQYAAIPMLGEIDRDTTAREVAADLLELRDYAIGYCHDAPNLLDDVYARYDRITTALARGAK